MLRPDFEDTTERIFAKSKSWFALSNNKGNDCIHGQGLARGHSRVISRSDVDIVARGILDRCMETMDSIGVADRYGVPAEGLFAL
jgi:hypothetical protein